MLMSNFNLNDLRSLCIKYQVKFMQNERYWLFSKALAAKLEIKIQQSYFVGKEKRLVSFPIWNQLHNLIFVKLKLLQVFGRRNDSLRAWSYREAPSRFPIIPTVWQQLFKQRPFWSCPWFYMCSSNYEWGGLRSVQNHQTFYSLLLL